MTPKQADFNARASEVRDFIATIKRRETLTPPPPMSEVAVDRAAAVLFIYNLLELGARSVGEAIFEEVEVRNIEFDDLASPLRKELLRLLKKKGAQDACDSMNSIRTDIYAFAYDPKEVFAGNVDTKKWRERLKELGCQGALPPDTHSLLVRIKTSRNDLAHGHTSFGTTGANYTLSEIEDAFLFVEQIGTLAFSEVDALIASGGLKK